MRRFIRIALDIIAEEGVDVQDRLLDLSKLCEKFSPLLYHLNPSNPLFCALQHIHHTWESLKSFNNPLKLVVRDRCFAKFIKSIFF